MKMFSRLPETQQGLLYMLIGIVTLLYALGFFTKGITIIIVICALYAIIKGFIKTGLYDKLIDAMHRK